MAQEGKRDMVEKTEDKTEPEKLGDNVKDKKKKFAEKECPYCHKTKRNLPNHIRSVHKSQAEAEGYKTENPPLTRERLLGSKNAVLNLPGNKIYYCTNCRAKLRKGENPCWKCGESLNWSDIQ